MLRSIVLFEPELQYHENPGKPVKVSPRSLQVLRRIVKFEREVPPVPRPQKSLRPWLWVSRLFSNSSEPVEPPWM